jgi:haloacid dehalogenase-like hydrolase
MRARGALTAPVSGGFPPFTERVRAALGFDLVQANRLETSAGRLTGRVLEPVRRPDSKLGLLRRLAQAGCVAPATTLAVGDGANDIPMLQAAGLGVAYRAHPRVKGALRVAIEHGDLTALLSLQGIARRDFMLVWARRAGTSPRPVDPLRRPAPRVGPWPAPRAAGPVAGFGATAAPGPRARPLRPGAAPRTAGRPDGRPTAARTSCRPAWPG